MPGPRDEIERVTAWARKRADVRALLLVGSYARGNPRPDSDIDLMLLTERPDTYLENTDWIAELGATLIATESWGVIRSLRLSTFGGFEVELGVGGIAWANLDPVDGGTQRVVAHGARILYDPDGLLEGLISAVDRPL